MTPAPWFVGIDVSKAQLDIALRPEGRFVVPNDETGRAHVVERLRALPVALIVLEATGGLELPLIGALVARYWMARQDSLSCAPAIPASNAGHQNAFVSGRNSNPVVETRSSIAMGSRAGKNAADPYSASTTDSSQP